MGHTTHIISDKHSILPATCSISKVFAPPIVDQRGCGCVALF